MVYRQAFSHILLVNPVKIVSLPQVLLGCDLLTLRGGTHCGNGEILAKPQQVRGSASTAPARPCVAIGDYGSTPVGNSNVTAGKTSHLQQEWCAL